MDTSIYRRVTLESFESKYYKVLHASGTSNLNITSFISQWLAVIQIVTGYIVTNPSK